jgi:hypothetical protein
MPFRASKLLAAASACAASHELMWQMWNVLGGHGRSPEHARALARPDAREKLIAMIRQARQLDETTVRHLQSALNG